MQIGFYISEKRRFTCYRSKVLNAVFYFQSIISNSIEFGWNTGIIRTYISIFFGKGKCFYCSCLWIFVCLVREKGCVVLANIAIRIAMSVRVGVVFYVF